MLSQIKLIDEDGGVVVPKYDQGLIMIDYFAQLNEKSVEGICRVLWRPGGTTGGVSNTGFAVSSMAEANLQGIIYYIKHFKRIGHTCTHADVDIFKICAMYHQKYMEEAHKDPEVLRTFTSKYWPKTLERVEE